jgi:hypothetical protein
MIELSKQTALRVSRLFHEKDRAIVEQHLAQECGDNLPLVNPDYLELAERIRFAVLKLSNGDVDKLLFLIREAAKDWRDTLVAAGFGHDEKAHLQWLPEPKQDK